MYLFGELNSFLDVHYLSRARSIFQCLHYLSVLRVLHLLPQLYKHSVYVCGVPDPLREPLPADHLAP